MVLTRNPRKHSVTRPVAWKFLRQVSRKLGEWLLAFFLLAAIFLSFHFAYKRITEHAFFPLKRVLLVRPLIYGDREAIMDVVAACKSQDMLRIDIRTLTERIARLSWVESVSISKQWPDALQVDVHERVPILRWGKEDFLDRKGKSFLLPASPKLDTLFPVTGPKGHEKQVLDMYLTIHPWLRRQGVDMRGLILDTRLVWHVILGKELDVIIGREELNQRFKKLAVVNRRIIKNYEKYIHSVDLRYRNGFSVRWKDGVETVGDEREKRL